jgi:maltooligosyltrehalose trehalohydrolase
VRLGATPKAGQQTQFLVWAPKCQEISIEVVAGENKRYSLKRGDRNYFSGSVPVTAGTRYLVVPDGQEGRPDPASRFQPEGVHGPSEVVDSSFNWTDAEWRGIPLNEYVIYELHIGTFSDEGTFDGAIRHLDELKELGVSAIEIMPVAQFPGKRNWGYDGVQPFAVQNSYGGPAGLKRLVDSCHARGIAVVLDVVYNHLGPEGNYLGEFAPYFTEKYKTPWGPAVNVDEAHSDEVRRFFIDNALEWITDYHIDALRLDAVHGILDTSARPFLAELSESVAQRAKKLNRQVFLIAESDLNDVRMISPATQGGMGMHTQWTDDFHHSLHALLTREDSGYYADFGTVAHFAESLRSGYVYKGDYSGYRMRRHGNDPSGARDVQFIICIQNHDQIGNRMLGERISRLTDFERQKVGAAAVLLSPFVPLLYMGDEYAETQPFPYFVDHSDCKLITAVRKGRKEEFASFAWKGEPPDPADPVTFESARMRRPQDGEHAAMRRFYRKLLQLRKEFRLGAGAQSGRRVMNHDDAEAISIVSPVVSIAFGFSDRTNEIRFALPAGQWRRQVASREQCWNGPGDESPEQISSSGEIAVTLSGPSALLYTRVG